MAARKKKEADPPRQLADLAAALERGPLGRLYVVRGEERYFREQAIERLRSKAEADGLEASHHTGNRNHPDHDLALLMGDLGGGSLFSAGRFVVVRDAGPLLAKQGKNDSAFVRAAKAFVESEEAPGCLVVSADSVRADHALAKLAPKAGGLVLTCRRLWDSAPPWNPDPRQAELVQWFVRRSHELACPLNPEQALFVVAATGNDLYALEAQLEKLSVSGTRALTEIVGWSATGSPFVVAEDLVAGRLDRAVSGIEALFRGGFREKDGKRLVDHTGLSAILLSGILGGVRKAVAGASSPSGDPVEGAARAGWNLPPTKRADFAAQVRARTREQWRAMLEDVTKLEHAARSGRSLDANDFCLFALKWRTKAAEGRPAVAGGGRR